MVCSLTTPPYGPSATEEKMRKQSPLGGYTEALVGQIGNMEKEDKEEELKKGRMRKT